MLFYSFPNNTGIPGQGQGTIVPWDTGNVTFTSGLAYSALEILPNEVVKGGLPYGKDGSFFLSLNQGRRQLVRHCINSTLIIVCV